MRRAHRSWLPFVAAALSVVVMLPSFAGPTDAATSNWTSKCEVRIRTAPKMSSTTLRIIREGAVVKATGTVSGGSYRADCPSSVSGSTWLKVVAINGKSTTTALQPERGLRGLQALQVGSQPDRDAQADRNADTEADRHARDHHELHVELRGPAAVARRRPRRAPRRSSVPTRVVTASGKVSGASWSADCKTSVSGSTWYKITAVGGKSVSSLYGVSAVYAASGLFRSVTTTSAATGKASTSPTGRARSTGSRSRTPARPSRSPR